MLAPTAPHDGRPVTPPSVVNVDLSGFGPTVTGLQVTPEQQAVTTAQYHAWLAAGGQVDETQSVSTVPPGNPRC